MADVCQRVKKRMSQEGPLRRITVEYLKKCSTPKPKRRGICFLDAYIDGNWEETAASPDNDCYLRVGYKLRVSDNDCKGESSLQSCRQDRRMMDQIPTAP